MTYAVSLTVLMISVPHRFAGIFTNDERLLNLCAWALPIYIAGGLVFGAQTSFQQSFVSLGQARISLLLACLRKVILLTPLLYIFPVTVARLPIAEMMSKEAVGLVLCPREVFAIFLAEPVSDVAASVCTTIVFVWFYRKYLRGPQSPGQADRVLQPGFGAGSSKPPSA